MSKLVLLMNDSRICAGCRFCESEFIGEGINKKYATSHCRLNGYEIKELKEKPDWCLLRLLKPLPEKMDSLYFTRGGKSPDYKMGWNDCLNAIKGDEYEYEWEW